MKKIISATLIITFLFSMITFFSGCTVKKPSEPTTENTDELVLDLPNITKEDTENSSLDLPEITKETSITDSHPIKCVLYDNYIYLCENGIMKLPIKSSDHTMIDRNGKSFDIYSDYMFFYKDDGLYIKNLNDNTDNLICSEKNMIFSCANENYAFFYNPNTLKGYAYNLESKELYPMKNFNTPKLNFLGIEGEFIYYLYAGGGSIYKHNIKTDAKEILPINEKISSCFFSRNKIHILTEDNGVIATDLEGKNKETLISASKLNGEDYIQSIEIQNDKIYIKYKNSLEIYDQKGNLIDSYNDAFRHAIYKDTVVYKSFDEKAKKNYIICKQ